MVLTDFPKLVHVKSWKNRGRVHRIWLKVDFHCRVIFTCFTHVNFIYARKQNRDNVWKVTRKRKSWTSLNFHVYPWPFIHCLYFIYERKFYVRSQGKVMRQWKSTLSLTFISHWNASHVFEMSSCLFRQQKRTTARAHVSEALSTWTIQANSHLVLARSLHCL